jgi:hypothetical protein
MTVQADRTRVGQKIKLPLAEEEERSTMDDGARRALDYGYLAGDGKVTIVRAR